MGSESLLLRAWRAFPSELVARVGEEAEKKRKRRHERRDPRPISESEKGRERKMAFLFYYLEREGRIIEKVAEEDDGEKEESFIW